MSPENAKVFFVEDDDISRGDDTDFLKMGGHTVVEIATSLDEALGKIPDLGRIGVNVAVVDGNLSTGDKSVRDGETVARQIKARHPNIIVIGHALRNPINAAHINCPKVDGGSKLAEVVRNA